MKSKWKYKIQASFTSNYHKFRNQISCEKRFKEQLLLSKWNVQKYTIHKEKRRFQFCKHPAETFLAPIKTNWCYIKTTVRLLVDSIDRSSARPCNFNIVKTSVSASKKKSWFSSPALLILNSNQEGNSQTRV